MRWPDRSSQKWLAAGAGAWVGAVLAVRSVQFALVLVGLGTLGLVLGKWEARVGWLGLGLVATSLSAGWMWLTTEVSGDHQIPNGAVELVAKALSDSRESNGTSQLLIDPVQIDRSSYRGPDLLAVWDELDQPIAAGEWLWIEGDIWEGERRWWGRETGGTVRVQAHAISPPTEPWFQLGNHLREVVVSRLPPEQGPATALLRGFLIGDTTGLSAYDREQLRRAGLSHYVAVSGSNVALFLGVWFLLLFPIARTNVTRAVAGIIGLIIMVVITRWEPSVLRASVMASLLLVTRAVGITAANWALLGAAVFGLLVVEPSLAGSVGFSLSVAATIGVMVGYRWFKNCRPQFLWKLVGATLGAQLAVVPLLLFWFGQIPLLSPIANLLAAPLVSAATLAGLIGVAAGGMPVVGADLPVHIGELLASGVLYIARVAGNWPQLGLSQTVLMLGLGLGVFWAVRTKRWQLLVPAGVGAMVWVLMISVGQAPSRPVVIYLDVGQGDAALILGEEATVLIDGGPSPSILADKLSQYRISALDLLIVSHPHADHVEGLTGIVKSVPIGKVWFGSQPHSTAAWERLSSKLTGAGVTIESPKMGGYGIGDLDLIVLGPQRRYLSPNDHSLVISIDLAGTSFLFPGDIETFAQADLGPLPTQVLKVPHQGAATSDLDWLADTNSDFAVISVGTNRYGHPADEVIDTLTSAGSTVLRTDHEGDVLIRP